MEDKGFESLIKRFADIAAAVNKFSSEAIQREAFSVLVNALLGKSVGQLGSADSETQAELEPDNGRAPAERVPDRKTESEVVGGGRRRKAAVGNSNDFKLVRDLDLRPTGKQSFADFAKEKAPSSNQDKYAAILYYLERILGLEKITLNHIGTVFRETTTWRDPGNIKAGVSVTAARKNTINTSDYNDLKLTPKGRNFVEHDLPAPAKKK